MKVSPFVDQSTVADPINIYGSRSLGLALIEQNAGTYEKIKKKETKWKKRQLGMVLAPLFTAAALMTTSKIEDMEASSKGLIGIGALVASGILATAGELRIDRQTKKAYNVAASAAAIYDELGIIRDKWVEEGLEPINKIKQAKQSRQAK